MTSSGRDEHEVLEELRRARPELSTRVDAVAGLLAELEPSSREQQPRSPLELLSELAELGLITQSQLELSAADASSTPDLLYGALLRSFENGPDALLLVCRRVNRAVDSYGPQLLPGPAQMLDLYEVAKESRDSRHLDQEVARLAGRLGGAALVTALRSRVRSDPEGVLDFWEASVAAQPGPLSAPPPPAGQEGGIMRVIRGVRSIRDLLAESWPGRSRGPADLHGPDAEVVGPAVISTGICEGPGLPGVPRDRTLDAGRRYHVFVEIGPDLTADALDLQSPPLPSLPGGTVLQVVLFGFDDGLRPVPGAQVGELVLTSTGRSVVSRSPVPHVVGRRLYLPVDAPATAGTYRLRCNVYVQRTLLQSRLFVATVTEPSGQSRVGALKVTLDFAAVHDLDPTALAQRASKTLSVLVNDNGNGSHGFRYFGENDYIRDITVGAGVLDELLGQARGGLCRASWGSEVEPQRAEFATLRYRYAVPDRAILTEDLVALARRGYKLWDVLVDPLSGGDWEALRGRMRAPGRVEFSNKASLDLLIPAACLYDQPLAFEQPDLTVCETFMSSLGKTPVAALACFSGDCPSYDDETVVCPSGFWGFRHEIGYEASLTDAGAKEARNQVVLAGVEGTRPVFTVGASMDEGLVLRDAHLSRLSGLGSGGWHLARSRTELFALFKSVEPTVVYLYGHGGGDRHSPFFEVGSDADGPIPRASLRGRASWPRTHPLVFLNGCHTAALSPQSAFSYATGFLTTAHASAVIGTEIAVFETLASVFAEECLRRLVTDRSALGQAVRQARLALLDQGVPLGLAYVAFGSVDVTVAAE